MSASATQGGHNKAVATENACATCQTVLQGRQNSAITTKLKTAFVLVCKKKFQQQNYGIGKVKNVVCIQCISNNFAFGIINLTSKCYYQYPFSGCQDCMFHSDGQH